MSFKLAVPDPSAGNGTFLLGHCSARVASWECLFILGYSNSPFLVFDRFMLGRRLEAVAGNGPFWPHHAGSCALPMELLPSNEATTITELIHYLF